MSEPSALADAKRAGEGPSNEPLDEPRSAATGSGVIA